jgi:hypothetical protein
MAGSSSLSENVWPGYVAAMASLLLSLLLVVAVLVITIGQVGMIQDDYIKATRRLGYSSFEDVLSVAKSLGVDVDTLLHASTEVPTDLSSIGTQPAQGGVDIGEQGGEDLALPSPLEVSELLDFSSFTYDREMAKVAAQRLSSADAALLQSVDLSMIDLSKIRLSPLSGTLNLSPGVTDQMLEQIDFSQVDFGQADPQLLDRAKPFLAQRALEFLLDIKNSPVEKPQRKPPPPPPLPAPPPAPPVPERPLPEVGDQGEPVLLLDFVDRVQGPDEKTIGEIRERLRRMRNQADSLLIWVQDQPDPDTAAVRSANLQMLSIRRLALEVGWPSPAVTVRYSKGPSRVGHLEGFHIHISTPGVTADE